METHEPNVYPTILGGVSQGFWSPFLDLGAWSAPQSGGVDIWFMRFHFRVSIKHIYENCKFKLIDPKTKIDGEVWFMGL